MNLRFVEAFLWVARLKSFKAAAEQMHTTQAAISGRIATLEEELGTKLFERDNRSVKLTHRGAGLIPLAEKMLDLAAQMRQTVVVKEAVTGTLRLPASSKMRDSRGAIRCTSWPRSIMPRASVRMRISWPPQPKEFSV